MHNGSPMIRLILCLFMLTAFWGCGNKIKTLEDKLRRTITEFGNGKLLNQFQYRAGYPLDFDKIQIKATFKEDYSYVAVVTFKKKDLREQERQMTLPKLGALPSSAGAKSQSLSVRFRYFEEEDRWYFETYL